MEVAGLGLLAGLGTAGLNYLGNQTAAKSADKAAKLQEARYQEQKGMAQPYLASGEAAQKKYDDLTGVNGAEAQKAALAAQAEDPAWLAQEDAAANLLKRNAARTGNTGGNILAALYDRGQQSKYQWDQNNLNSLRGDITGGQNTLGLLTGAGTAAAGTAGRFGTVGGNYSGSGMTGLGQGMGGGLSLYNYFNTKSGNSSGGV